MSVSNLVWSKNWSIHRCWLLVGIKESFFLFMWIGTTCFKKEMKRSLFNGAAENFTMNLNYSLQNSLDEKSHYLKWLLLIIELMKTIWV